ncbi:hypothetical protein ACFLUV_04640, partial [Elusimicrobiota bacterium]
DQYTVEFPNYSSLIHEDEYETSLDTQTYTEISSNAGEDVLNYSNKAVSVKIKRSYSKYLNSILSYQLDLRDYADQTIVRDDGSFSSNKRRDTENTLFFGIRFGEKMIMISLDNEFNYYDSNQNSFDANATKFIKNFYSYYAIEFMPAISLYVGSGENHGNFKIWLDIEFRNYLGRLAQNKNADYLNDRIDQIDNGFGISYSFPVANSLFITAQLNRRTASSNMKYEGNYKYNYTVSNYLLGLNWQY